MRPTQSKKSAGPYAGFEQGPIRPPSEARSLLIRLTRNCPWNRCAFCPVYKGSRFSIRPADHVKQDIDLVHKYVGMLAGRQGLSGRPAGSALHQTPGKVPAEEAAAFYAALNWISGGSRAVFIQDANSLIVKPAELVEILTHLKKRFPWIDRVTSYARSDTIARISDEDLSAIGRAGLNRIHIGLESGCDAVLKMVNKGVTRDIHIRAGLKVKAAGIQLSEYVMPGLGGVDLSEAHARETAEALNRINPDFIRLRTLTVMPGSGLDEALRQGRFVKCSDLQVAREILLFIESLHGVTGVLKSDHVLNLFQDLEGPLPRARDGMIRILRDFLDLDPRRRCLYQVGRRLGIFTGLADLESPRRLAKAERAADQLGVTLENVDEIVGRLTQRFI